MFPNKRRLQFISSFAFSVILFAGFAFLAPFTGAKGDHKKWLNEEVVWIISRVERKEFEKLSDDAEREEFISSFWKRRDPTPSTERNEYKEEHYRRLLYATKTFPEGLPGWKTDRGRIYILHGPPDGEYFYPSLSTISPLREVPYTKRSPNTIVWVYHQNQNARYYKGEIRLVFQPSSGLTRQSFTLGESKAAQEKADQLSKQFGPASDQNWLEADVRYQLVMAGPPALMNAKGAELPASGIGEVAKYIEDLFRSPGEIWDERRKEIERREQARQELREVVKTTVSFAALEPTVNYQSFYQEEENWLLPIRVSLPVKTVGKGTIDLYAALLDSRGRVFDEFLDSVEIQGENLNQPGPEQLHYYNTFSVPSGEYVLKVVVRELATIRVGYREAPLSLKAVQPQELKLSPVLITNRVEVLPENAEKGRSDSIIFNGARFLPNPSRVFHEGGHLFLYCQIWTPEGERQISLNANFIRNGEIVNRLQPRRLEKSAGACLGYGTAVPLAGFEPGDYILQVQVLDHTSKHFAIQRESFTISQ